MPQLSQMSSGAQDTGPPPELRGTEVQLVSVCRGLVDGGCYRKARKEVLTEYKARKSGSFMFNPFPCTAALFYCTSLGRAELVKLILSGHRKGYEPRYSNAAGEHVIYQDPFEQSVLLQSLPWLHYTTALPFCFVAYLWSRTRLCLSSQGLGGDRQLRPQCRVFPDELYHGTEPRTISKRHLASTGGTASGAGGA